MGIMLINSDDLTKLGDRLYDLSKATPRAIEWRLTHLANQRIKSLIEVTPSAGLSDLDRPGLDIRHPVKLKDSYGMVKSPGMREITTSTPYKFLWVTQGTTPHMIFPRFKKALMWPGLAHPIPWVGPPYTREHPGNAPNPYHQNLQTGNNDEFYFVQGIADWVEMNITHKLPGITLGGVE